jgi:hypothetical protein
VATTSAPPSSSASASAIAPVPVPDVEHTRTCRIAEELDTDLDDDLRLGPRHERTRVAAKRQTAEAPLPEDVGERLSAGAPLNEGPNGRIVHVVVRGDQLGSLDAEHCARRSTRHRFAPSRLRARRAAQPPARRSLERAPSLLCLQPFGEVAQVSADDLVEPVLRELDPVVGDAALGEVVRADLLGALAGADLRAPLRASSTAAARARARTAARAARASAFTLF